MHARADLANHFASLGATYKHKVFTCSAEGFYGWEGKEAKNNADKDHKGFMDKNVWMRMGVDMPLGSDTNVSWNGLLAKECVSQIDFS